MPEAKKHFEILDGLRGVAAVSVVLFHFMEMVFSDYSKNFMGHGFLAVDFFFCLSGFVIGYAYDDRMGKIGVKSFFIARAIRLHPLVIFGSVLGLLMFLFDPFGGPPAAYGWDTVALIFLCSILLIPFPTMPERYFNNFSFDAPAWSLFWEYVANIVYAYILCRMSRRYLRILVAVAGLWLCYVGYHRGNLMGGWGGRNFWDGGARIAFSFSAGLLVYRSNWVIKNSLGFIGLSLLLLAALMMPYFKWNWMAELAVVLLYLPLLIALGAGARLRPAFQKLCVFSGKISYPLYMTHYAFIWVFGHFYDKFKPSMTQVYLIVVASTICLIGVAYLVMIAFDIPVRRYLTNRRKQASAPPPVALPR